jgi:hypothetical protein
MEERLPKPSPPQTAFTVQAERLEVFSSLGRLPPLVGNGVFNWEPCWPLSGVPFRAVQRLWRK